MTNLEVTCSMCGELFPALLSASTKQELTLYSLKKRLEAKRWIVQVNGDNIDTYCSKECAK